MNPNPDVKFRFPFFDIFSSGITCFFTGSFFYIYISMTLLWGFSDIIGLIIYALISVCLIGFILSGVKEFFTDHTSFLLYYKYKKLFSQYTFTSVQDILDATDNTYDDVCEIRSELRELLNKKCISGFKIEYDKVGTFTFRERKHYQNKTK